MKVSIFQPTYLPWLGFLKAIQWSGTFVFLDDVQFEHHSWQHRNKIKSADGEIILTVPIVRKFPQRINEVKINFSRDWTKKHLKSIQLNYRKTPFFKEFFSQVKNFYKDSPLRLVELNVRIIKNICDFLEIKPEFCYSSNLNVQNLHKNEKIIAILKELGANQYLHAEGATEYMQEAKKIYDSSGVKLIPLKFEYPRYSQLYGTFLSHLSIIDVIFNCGKEKTTSILKNIKLS